MRYTRAIVRPPAANYAQGLTDANEGPPDYALALSQHQAYCQALIDCGLTLTTLPADPRFPDSTFVEDTAIVTARGAILTRPGAPSRAGETASMLPVLQDLYGELARITAPGTVDGGDVCEIGEHFLIGLSQRTNEEGARQLAGILQGMGYRADTLDIRSVPRLLHLKTGMSWLGGNWLLVSHDLPRTEALAPYELIITSAAEDYAANCIHINDRVLIPAGYPELARSLVALGFELLPLQMSEYRKMDGGLSCLSLRME